MDEEEYMNKLIQECRWRKDVAGVPICIGNCEPCVLIIDHGKCDTLIKYFKTKSPDYIYDAEEEEEDE